MANVFDNFDISESAMDVRKLIFTIQNQQYRSMPIKPLEWRDRIDDKVWSEFIECCHGAVPIDSVQRQIEYKLWKRMVMLSLCIFCIIGVFATFLGSLGVLNDNKLFWISGVILGFMVFVCTFTLIPIAACKSGKIDRDWKLELKRNLYEHLMQFNDKYEDSLYCYVVGDNDELNINEKQPGIIRMYVMMELFVDTVVFMDEQEDKLKTKTHTNIQPLSDGINTESIGHSGHGGDGDDILISFQ